MIPTATALAPRDSRNGPMMLRAPSYVISANRLTMPIVSTNLKAILAVALRSEFAISSSTQAETIRSGFHRDLPIGFDCLPDWLQFRYETGFLLASSSRPGTAVHPLLPLTTDISIDRARPRPDNQQKDRA